MAWKRINVDLIFTIPDYHLSLVSCPLSPVTCPCRASNFPSASMAQSTHVTRYL